MSEPVQGPRLLPRVAELAATRTAFAYVSEERSMPKRYPDQEGHASSAGSVAALEWLGEQLAQGVLRPSDPPVDELVDRALHTYVAVTGPLAPSTDEAELVVLAIEAGVLAVMEYCQVVPGSEVGK